MHNSPGHAHQPSIRSRRQMRSSGAMLRDCSSFGSNRPISAPSCVADYTARSEPRGGLFRSEMMDQTVEASPRLKARIAGGLYLLVIVAGAFHYLALPLASPR